MWCDLIEFFFFGFKIYTEFTHMYIIISPLYLNTILLYIWFVSVEQKNKLSTHQPVFLSSVRPSESETVQHHQLIAVLSQPSLHRCITDHVIAVTFAHRCVIDSPWVAITSPQESPLRRHRFTNVSPSPMIRESIVSNAFCVIWTDIFVRQRGVNELAWNLQHQHRTFSLYLYFLLSLV